MVAAVFVLHAVLLDQSNILNAATALQAVKPLPGCPARPLCFRLPGQGQDACALLGLRKQTMIKKWICKKTYLGLFILKINATIRDNYIRFFVFNQGVLGLSFATAGPTI